MIQTKAYDSLTCATIESVVRSYSGWKSVSTRQGYEALVHQLKKFIAQTVEKNKDSEPHGRKKHGVMSSDSSLASDIFLKREIDEKFCTEFTDYLLSTVRPSSARGYLEKLRTLLRRMQRDGRIAENPLPNVSDLLPRTSTTEKVFLTKEELLHLQCTPCPSESTKLAFLFSCYTGLLKGEVKELQWDSIHYSGTGLVLIRPVENGLEHVRVPIVKPARAILETLERDYAASPQTQQDDHVFHLRSNSSIADDLNRWVQESGIEKSINYMTSRHTFATMALRAGVDLYVVAKWCGYSNVNSAQIYADMVAFKTNKESELLELAFC